MTTPTVLGALLTCQSFFSEGRSTVSPRQLVQTARRAGFTAVGLVDWCSVAGAVELCAEAHEHGLGAVIGVTLPVLKRCCCVRRYCCSVWKGNRAWLWNVPKRWSHMPAAMKCANGLVTD
ncbi:hypothetical protein LAJ19_20990 (plasmid) [Deinococcus taeanensis]|uniref:PHP domain-containing protein n=1 Tax=Deinococcus taeanensis TaxID=2737050 RepID=UPI001CDBF57D|nr:PHP domain-containing protein [Deinococcus taeanensis]UBV45274.1 hypothetical protein LAJ19_20990 [Deinococcus taeanensis]